MPQHRIQAARVHDLIAALDKKLRLVSDSYREVESVLLYGSRLSGDRQLEAIIPDLAASSPGSLQECGSHPPTVIPSLSLKR
jgi:hypothetical protein